MIKFTNIKGYKMNVALDFDAERDAHYLNIPEMREYRKSSHEANFDKNNADPIILSEKTQQYLKWFICYCNDRLKGKNFKDEQIVCHIFRTDSHTEYQFKEFLKKSLFIARQYVEHLESTINPQSISRFKHTLNSLDTDIEFLILNYEIVVKKSETRGFSNSGRYPHLRPTDIYSAARELFYIEETELVENLYLRDIKPVVMFQMRQMIEIFGKNLLGYTSIINKDGTTAKKLTQIAWEFIQLECKRPNSRITFPFDINLILPINKWCNSFVHTTYIYSGFIQAYALRVLGLLFVGSGKRITTYDGKSHGHFDFADIEISQYNSLKVDFLTYIDKKSPGAIVNWLPEKRVGAYILSL